MREISRGASASSSSSRWSPSGASAVCVLERKELLGGPRSSSHGAKLGEWGSSPEKKSLIPTSFQVGFVPNGTPPSLCVHGDAPTSPAGGIPHSLLGAVCSTDGGAPVPIPPAGSTRRFRTKVRYIGLSIDSSSTPVGVTKASGFLSPCSSPCGECKGRSRNSWGWPNPARSARGMGATGAEFSLLSGASRYCSSRGVLALVEARGSLLCSKNPETRDNRFNARNGALGRISRSVGAATYSPDWAICLLEISRNSMFRLSILVEGVGRVEKRKCIPGILEKAK